MITEHNALAIKHHDAPSYVPLFLLSLDIRTSSKNTYARQLKEFFRWCAHNTIITPQREHILAYREMLREEKQLSALTIAGYITALRRFFEWLEIMRHYPNIAKGIKGPKRSPGFKKDILTIEQIRALLNSVDRATFTGKRDYALINLMIRTGIRTIEASRALKQDVTQQAGFPVLLIHGKGHDSKDEVAVLTHSTLEPIKEYLHARGTLKNNDSLFVSHSSKNFGTKLTTRSISRIVKNRMRAIGIDDSRLTAHSLRHTAITLSLLAGSTAQEARSMARHANINTTLIYAHNIQRIAHAPEHKIEEFLKL